MPTISSTYNDIANAIRANNGLTTSYTPAQMPDAIRGLNPLAGLTTSPESVWTSGTDNDVLLMIQAADAGEINLTRYWHIGDTRSVSLSAMTATGVSESHSAQTVEMVLYDQNPITYTYVTPPASGRTHPFFIYGQKNCLTNLGYLNSSNTNTGGWGSTARKTWCDNVYRNAVPTYLKTITKQVVVKSALPSSSNSTGGSLATCNCYFFLPNAAELGLYGPPARDSENLNIYAYYFNNNNIQAANDRRELLTKTSSGNTVIWWTRSVAVNRSTTNFIAVSVDANYHKVSQGSSTLSGLAPCGCI